MEDFAAEHFWVALPIALSLFFIAIYFAYRSSYFVLPAKSKAHPIAFKHLAGAFGTWFVITLIFMPLLYIFAKKVPSSTPDMSNGIGAWLHLVYIAVAFVALYSYLFALKKDVINNIFFEGQPHRIKALTKGLAIGAISWCVAYPTVLVVNLITGEIGKWIWGDNKIDQVAVKHLKGLASQPLLYTLMVICVIFLVPLIEELLFRGFLQSWIRRYIGRIGGIIFTAIIFALVHYSPAQGSVNFELICSLFVLSCFLGFIYEREKTLWAPITLHAVFNGITVLFLSITE